MMQVNLLPHAFGRPTYATPMSAGMDLYAAVENDICIYAGQTQMIPTGIRIAIRPITKHKCDRDPVCSQTWCHGFEHARNNRC
jgi:dUTPase